VEGVPGVSQSHSVAHNYSTVSQSAKIEGSSGDRLRLWANRIAEPP